LFFFARGQAERRNTELGIGHELRGKEIYNNVAYGLVGGIANRDRADPVAVVEFEKNGKNPQLGLTQLENGGRGEMQMVGNAYGCGKITQKTEITAVGSLDSQAPEGKKPVGCGYSQLHKGIHGTSRIVAAQETVKNPPVPGFPGYFNYLGHPIILLYL
ncbi:unnamed protein product, partial [marine sediment metagenome]